MDTIDGMRTFAAVAAAGSFTAAAKKLGISTNLASKYVARLEDRLGVRLMNRTTRSLSLTEVGQAYFARCQQLLDDLDDLESAVQHVQTGPRGTLTVTAPQTFGEMYLTGLIATFLDEQPGLSVNLTLTDRFVDLVAEGFDLAIRIGALEDSSLIARRLADNRIVACAAPAYLARASAPTHPEALKHHDCIIDTNVRSPRRWPFQVDGARVHVNVDGRFHVNSSRAVRDLALQGAGIALCPAYAVGPDIAAGDLTVVLQDFLVLDVAVYAVYPHNRYLAPKVRSFVDFMADRLGPTPVWERF